MYKQCSLNISKKYFSQILKISLISKSYSQLRFQVTKETTCSSQKVITQIPIKNLESDIKYCATLYWSATQSFTVLGKAKS